MMSEASLVNAGRVLKASTVRLRWMSVPASLVGTVPYARTMSIALFVNASLALMESCVITTSLNVLRGGPPSILFVMHCISKNDKAGQVRLEIFVFVLNEN